MTSNKSTETGSGVAVTCDTSLSLAARAYQTEMFEKSVKENIIVVMDTGSGKTLVAALRIKHELATANLAKRIWFLTPTVALCQQQCKTLQSQIRSVEIRSFSSHDRVEAWRTPQLWDAALGNVRVAVATYAVLQNALSDGFVKMDSIALIVFDEAHNCVGKSPGSKIMQDFYWQDKHAGRDVPRILGMTASPTNKAGGVKLKKLEATLDANCKSPQLHRESLRSHVNRPTVSAEYYHPSTLGACCRSIASMRAVLARLDIQQDPETIRLCTENTERSQARLAKVLKVSGGTFVLDQLRTFCGRASAIADTLGMLAVDFYIAKVVMLFMDSAQGMRPAAVAVDQTIFHTWDYSSRVYLASLLEGVEVDYDALTKAPTTGCISPKMDCLVRILVRCRHRTKGDNDRCIVFVAERATAVVLHHLLSRHLSISQLFRVGCVLGSSRHERGRRDLGDVHSPADQSDTIEKFRSGEINLMVATSVAEEGIDVSACNLVVCFDPPTSAKSFIQRRGRARRAGSEYFILIDETKQEEDKNWEDIEAQLRAEYEREDQQSALQCKIVVRETTSDRRFVEPVKGAVLDMENAKGRLQHFCAVVGGRASRYIDKQPYYIFEELVDPPPSPMGKEDAPLLKGKVVLPACVPHHLRTTWSKGVWRSERNASKDAAFEAYMRLYRAKLVNENLLPLTPGNADELNEDMASSIEIREQFNPWVRISKAWKLGEPETMWTYNTVVEQDSDGSKLDFETKIPAPDLDGILPFRVLLGDAVWKVRVESRASSITHHGVPFASRYQLCAQDRPQKLVVFEAAANSILKKLIPHILYKIEAQLVAQELQREVFFNIPMPSNAISLIRSAITTPARSEAEYGSLEFVGDASLKLLTTVFLTARHPLWPVGYLSPIRAELISNASLCAAVLERRVDRFLLTKPFDAETYLCTAHPDKKNCGRQTARRTLVHTVKALIGAGQQAGGYGTALAWTKALLPGSMDLPSLEVGRRQLFDLAPPSLDIPLSADLSMVEMLAGYSFQKRGLLIEALTHGSDFSAQQHGCYDRLCFLGNAIIESLVSDAIYKLARQGSDDGGLGMMSLYRAAAVNRYYLGYLALSRHVSQTRTAVQESHQGYFRQERYDVEFPLCRFLRHCSGELAAEMSATEERFTSLRGNIAKAIWSGDTYPWLLLTRLRANDFHAEMIESLVGAVFVDSGSVEMCKVLLDKIGLLPYLCRMISDKINVVHPKEHLLVLAGDKAVRYEVTKEQGLKCEVFVGDRLVAQAEGGVAEDGIHLEAAVEAIAKLSL